VEISFSMPCARSHLRPTSTALALAIAVLGVGCHGRSASARHESDRATAEAEAKAQEVTLTSAELESPAADARSSARTTGDDEMNAAFRLEQSDYRSRLQVALDQLDRAVLRTRPSRDLRTHRALLKADLDAVERSTEQDWATLRTKLERDLESEGR
jgi:hypothetical protein